jgi:DNA polymerase-4
MVFNGKIVCPVKLVFPTVQATEHDLAPDSAPGPNSVPRKIVHIDMDCFYAAIEVRDNPALRGKPVAVGGSSGRGVLTTCTYEARKFGCRSAMPTFKALRLCPQLILVPVRFDAYRAESRAIREIFARFSPLVEPLSLDEAYLDLSHLNSTGAAVAEEIRYRIRRETQLTASAGIAPNKMLAKVASDWKKPDGQFEVRPEDVEGFMRDLPARRIPGVGARTGERLKALGIETCGEMQRLSLSELHHAFGSFGVELHSRCRGIDRREVNPDRERKSVSNENTFAENLTRFEQCREKLAELCGELVDDVRNKHAERRIHKAFVKVKFADFKQTTVERAMAVFDADLYNTLLSEAWKRGRGRSVRLIGAGVRFYPLDGGEETEQGSFPF